MTMNTRKNHADLTAAEKATFVSAVLALKNKVKSVLKPGKMRRYDDFVQVHKNAMMGPDMIMPMPHGGPLFFPWHRILLRQYELALQAAGGDPKIAIPYSGWGLPWAKNPFTQYFMGGGGEVRQGQPAVTWPVCLCNKKVQDSYLGQQLWRSRTVERIWE